MTSLLRWAFVTAAVLHLACMFTQLSVSYFSGDMPSYWSQTPFASYSSVILGILWLHYGFMKELGKIALLLRIVSVCLWFVTLIGIILWVKPQPSPMSGLKTLIIDRQCPAPSEQVMGCGST